MFNISKKKKRKNVFILTSRNLENNVLSLITYLKQFIVVIFMNIKIDKK